VGVFFLVDKRTGCHTICASNPDRGIQGYIQIPPHLTYHNTFLGIKVQALSHWLDHIQNTFKDNDFSVLHFMQLTILKVI